MTRQSEYEKACADYRAARDSERRLDYQRQIADRGTPDSQLWYFAGCSSSPSDARKDAERRMEANAPARRTIG
jgi:hypothetical protein